MITGAIFDLDGTLLDSMYVWEFFATNYLSTKGISATAEDEAKIRYMNLNEAAEYFICRYGLKGTIEKVACECNELLRSEYFNKVKLKPGVRELLLWLQEAGVPMFVATATDRALCQAALQRLGVLNFFSGIITCAETGSGKTKPDIFFAAADKINSPPKTTWVFEDALHAVKTANEAGFRVCAVFDETESDHIEEIKALSDIYIQNFTQLDILKEKI